MCTGILKPHLSLLWAKQRARPTLWMPANSKVLYAGWLGLNVCPQYTSGCTGDMWVFPLEASGDGTRALQQLTQMDAPPCVTKACCREARMCCTGSVRTAGRPQRKLQGAKVPLCPRALLRTASPQLMARRETRVTAVPPWEKPAPLQAAGSSAPALLGCSASPKGFSIGKADLALQICTGLLQTCFPHLWLSLRLYIPWLGGGRGGAVWPAGEGVLFALAAVPGPRGTDHRHSWTCWSRCGPADTGTACTEPGAAQVPDNDQVDVLHYLVPRSLGSVGCLRSVLTDVNDGSWHSSRI